MCSDQHVKYRMPCGFPSTSSLLFDHHTHTSTHAYNDNGVPLLPFISIGKFAKIHGCFHKIIYSYGICVNSRKYNSQLSLCNIKIFSKLKFSSWQSIDKQWFCFQIRATSPIVTIIYGITTHGTFICGKVVSLCKHV